MTEQTLTQAAKQILTANKTALIASLTVITGDATRKATAAQTMALTSYKAFDANQGAIPAAAIAAFLNIDETGLKKLKQYVSRAKKLYDNQGATFTDKDGATCTIDHEQIMGDTPPSLTTVYKEFNAYKKRMTEQAEQAAYDRAQEMKAATAYVESGQELPQGVTNADELLTKARASSELGFENDFTAALAIGSEIVSAENSAMIEHDRAQELLNTMQAAIDELQDMESDSGIDAINLIAEYLNAGNVAHNEQIAA